MPEFPDEEMELDEDMMDLPDGMSEPKEILPEMRTIEMKDKKGKPLAGTLLDGDPVSLEWIEPKKTIDKSDFEAFLEHFPGGTPGFGATLGVAAVAIGTAAVAVRRKRREED